MTDAITISYETRIRPLLSHLCRFIVLRRDFVGVVPVVAVVGPVGVEVDLVGLLAVGPVVGHAVEVLDGVQVVLGQLEVVRYARVPESSERSLEVLMNVLV